MWIIPIETLNSFYENYAANPVLAKELLIFLKHFRNHLR
jgi:hypothetical protein